MKLNRILPIMMGSAALLTGVTACQDMLDTTSDGYVFDKDHRLDSANDSLYSALGILTQLQTIGERYAVLGEIRGDLVSVPSTAPLDYQNASCFLPLDSKDAFGSKRDYYAVINNCNVALSRMDTEISEHGTQVMLPEYAAIRAIRDWTMLQVALNYGSVAYSDKPVLSVEDADRDFALTSLDELVPKLIEDIRPYADIRTPSYGNIDGLSSERFFIRPDVLLADLYLYNGDYELAAATYYKVIDDNSYIMNPDNGYRWTSAVRTDIWGSFPTTYYNEAISQIPYASDAMKYHPNMVNLTYSPNPAIVPAPWFVEEMNTAPHYHIDNLTITNISGYLEGDLRGMGVDRNAKIYAASFGSYAVAQNSSEYLISKYLINGDANSSVSNPGNKFFENTSTVLTRHIALCRIPHIWLRYAEAVNRAGKPTLAFAVLKYGLRSEVLADETRVNPEEIGDSDLLIKWTDFNDQKYDNNHGTAMRGRGLGIAIENQGYVIPEFDNKADSIDWVEERILEEMAAETAFEGNRFFDLLRVSRHRPGHPAFLADKISRRLSDPAAAARLRNIENLWIK